VPPTPEPIGLPAAEAGTTPASLATGESPGRPAAKEQADLPAPASYKPGEAVSGLAGLLRPAKSHYALGEPIEVEFRLINQGPRSLAVDARLERSLTVTVTPVGNSAEPLFIRQVIPWADDGNAVPEARAFLREGAFWGRTLNLNVLFGKSLDAFPAPTPEEVSAGKDLSYERFGRNLFGFNKAGVYRVTAAYRVARSRAAEADAGAGPPSIWWTGDLETNAVTIQILERSPEGGP